ncbi:MAG: signal peptidase I [Candidatus Thermoplasmatota archaeon]
MFKDIGWDDTINLQMKTIVGNIIFVAVLLLILTRFLLIWTGGSFPINLVSSDSMEPTLYEGDIVAWTPTKIEDVEEGDVVVFKSHVHWPDEKILVHRVTDIKKDSDGNILLETKGDNNKWTDQAGPHIPEPYIRQDNLMGETLSIGGQPIKLPFVGQIGIWANSGIEKLSQPSNSKGVIPQIGIFTPLIISVAILVALIFLIPEKNKKYREKIRLLIFGHNNINLKKTFIIFLAAYLAFFTVIHCFAYDEVTTSFGVDEKSPESQINFGRIKQGQETFPAELPVVNPSVSSVKGIIYSTGETEQHISKKTFEIDAGQTKTVSLTAKTDGKTEKGSYEGKIKVYSSPFWMMYPDDLIKKISNFNTQNSVLILDLLTSLILTGITTLTLTTISFSETKYKQWMINRIWHPSKVFISKSKKQKIDSIKKTLKQKTRKTFTWIAQIDLLNDQVEKINSENVLKPILASLVIIPVLMLINIGVEAMLISSLTAGFIAYMISCKTRTKIILSCTFSLTVFAIIMISQTGLAIASFNYDILKILTLSMGAIGVYLLFVGIVMLPLTLTSWLITHVFRNVKERREPLLMLEGKCDL